MLTPNWNCELCVYRCKLNEAEDFCTTIAWRCWRSSWNRHVCHRFYYYRRQRSTTKRRTIRESQDYLESSSFVFLKKKRKTNLPHARSGEHWERRRKSLLLIIFIPIFPCAVVSASLPWLCRGKRGAELPHMLWTKDHCTLPMVSKRKAHRCSSIAVAIHS